VEDIEHIVLMIMVYCI